MFNRRKNAEFNLEKAETTIGKGTRCEGLLTSSGSIRVEGEFKGEIKTTGDLIVSEDGKIEATVEADNIFLAGSLQGNLTAEGRLQIAVTGRLNGDISVGDLLIDEGAFFNGSCKMQNNNCKMQIGEKERACSDSSELLQEGEGEPEGSIGQAGLEGCTTEGF